jgi:hypothetical protein
VHDVRLPTFTELPTVLLAGIGQRFQRLRHMSAICKTPYVGVHFFRIEA